MHLIFHIFKKDVRRLWLGVAIALAIQAAAAWFDRGDLQLEGQLSLLLLVTWAVLLALAVHEDPLVSDRQFWITRPARWRVLMGSKLLFAVMVVHLPSFLADVVVLATHGFRPWEWLASLFLRQLMLAAFCLTVIALAAVLTGFAQLALAVIGIVGLSSVAEGFNAGLYFRWIGVEETRAVLFGAILVAAAVTIIPWQFARRRTWQSRLVGIAGVLCAELLLALLSPVFVARVRAASTPGLAKISFQTRPVTAEMRDVVNGILRSRYGPAGGQIQMTIPVSVSGVPAGMLEGFDTELFDLIGPGNQRYQMRPIYIGQDFLILQTRSEIFDRLKDTPVELKGSVPSILYRIVSRTSMPVGAKGIVAGMGMCASEVIDLPGPTFNPERRRYLRVSCESPAGSELGSIVKLRQSTDSDPLGHQLEWTIAPGLSPLKRATATFTLGPRDVPQPSWTLEFSPSVSVGWQVVDLDLRNLRMRDYVLQ